MNNKNLITKLTDFKHKKKFELSEWEERGLNPSENIVIKEMIDVINSFLEDLISTLKNQKQDSNFKNDFLLLLNGISLESYDTEEKEFIMDYLNEISQVCELKIPNQLNELLYGKELADLISKTESEKIESGNYIQSYKVDEPCQNCGQQLKSLAVDEKEQVEYIGIADCFNCRKITLIHFPENTKTIDIFNFKVIEKIPYSKENELMLKEKIKTAHNNV